MCSFINILERLGFKIKKKSKNLSVEIPSWRPDIYGQIDLVEEIIRIKGFDKIQSIEPERKRLKPTLDFFQRHFHLAQRSVASKGYLETITWSFTDEKINNNFKENVEEIKIVNPISSDLNVLRNSLYPNLIFFLKKNIDRGFENQSLFEIGPSFIGKKPGEQITVVCGIRKENDIDIFDIKKDLVQTLVELGLDRKETKVDINTPSYYHPGRSGSIITKNDQSLIAYFGQIHPKIIDNIYGFEIFLENVVKYKTKNKLLKTEKLIVFIIFSFILIISSFNIFFLLSMHAIDKKRDLSILLSLGLTEKSIKKIFYFESIIISVLGIIIGGFLGVLLCVLQNEYGLVSLGMETAIIKYYPVKVKLSDLIMIVSIVFFISIVASIKPSLIAIQKINLNLLNNK